MQMTGRQPLSLYFHIPFCTKKCHYCHFYVLPDKENFKTLLMEGFEKELQLRSSLIAGQRLESIYFGGGTPSLFGPPRIAKLLDQIHSIAAHTSEDLEITLEANPEHINNQMIRDYALAGINRVSLGIQTLDDPLLIRLGRTHDSSTAYAAIHAIVEGGIENVSVDLMYDLPGQTLESWKKTVEKIAASPITHLSLYNLTIEPHTLFFKQREKLQKELPEPECSAQMYGSAIEILKQYSFSQYEISAFARRGKFSRHNIGYWTARSFLGFGPSAFSYWQGSRFRNIAQLNQYHADLMRESFPIDFEEKLDPIKRRKELLAIGLRLMDGVDQQAFEKAHGHIDTETLKVLQNLMHNGWLASINGRLKLTERGILFYDTVATDII